MSRVIPAGRVDHLLCLGPELLLDDGFQVLTLKQRLENLVLIGVHSALDDILAKPPGRIDYHEFLEARLGVDREHDARTTKVGPHHFLDTDRQGDLQMIKAFDFAIADCPVREERGVAAPAGVEKRRLASHIEECFVLAGKTVRAESS